MARKLKSDKPLFLATLLLVAASIVMVYSASAVIAMEEYDQPYLFLVKQATWAASGFLLLFVVMHVDYRSYRQPFVVWTALGVVLAALVLVLFAQPIKNTHRWFSFGGITLQPSELAKLAAILFVADLLGRRLERQDELREAVLPVSLVVGVLAGLILLEPDFGTALALVLIAGTMIFVAGLNYRYLVAVGLAILPVVTTAMLSAPYRRDRLLGFLNPWEDPLGKGFQVIQSLLAVGSGGLTGLGLMNGRQKLFYLPEPHTDFIFAVIAEELGLLGASLIVVAYCVITYRGLRIAARAPDPFAALLAVGITTMIAMQALVNISVVLGLMPTKGIPLPLVSAGGSSLLISLLGMGILLNVSQHGVPRT